MKFTELGKKLNSGEIKSAYFITGDDPFIVRSALKTFSSLAGQMRELNFVEFPAQSTPSQLTASLGTPPMLADYRITVLNGYNGDLTWLKNYLDNPVPGAILLLVGNLTANFNPFLSRIEVVDCNRLDAKYLALWISKKAAALGSSIDQQAATLLAEYCNRDMNRITSELNKLVDYALGRTITVSDVKIMVTPDLEIKIFALGEAIASKDAVNTVSVLETLLAEGNAPSMLIGTLFNHFRRLLFVSMNPTSDTLVSDLKVKSEYAIKMALKQAKAFSPKRLKSIFDKLCNLDADVKAGRMLDKNGLVTFVCETVLVA